MNSSCRNLSTMSLCAFPCLCPLTRSKVSPHLMKSLTRSTSWFQRLPQVMPNISFVSTDTFVWHVQTKCVFLLFPAECSFFEDTLYTFNNKSYKNKMPSSCYQVAAQDCTDELKFMVLLRKDSSEQHHINVKISEM